VEIFISLQKNDLKAIKKFLVKRGASKFRTLAREKTVAQVLVLMIASSFSLWFVFSVVPSLRAESNEWRLYVFYFGLFSYVIFVAYINRFITTIKYGAKR